MSYSALTRFAAVPSAASASPPAADAGARRLREARVVRLQGVGVDGRGRPGLPLDLERVAALLGRPERVGDHGHARGHLEHLLDAAHRPRAVGGEPLHRAAEHGGPGHHRHEHAGHRRVEPEDRLARHLRAAVEAARGLADDLELRRVLEGDVLRHRHRARLVHELPVGERAAAGPQHAAVLRAQRGPVHLPRLRRRGQEHLARGRSRLAQTIPLAGDARAATGELHAELRVGVGAPTGAATTFTFARSTSSSSAMSMGRDV